MVNIKVAQKMRVQIRGNPRNPCHPCSIQTTPLYRARIMITCKNIEEVRANIDLIDREIVKLLSERSKYVRQAAKFKKTTQDVKAPDRVEEVILKVRNMASEYGLDPEIVESVYRTMIACFIEHEMKEHSKQ